MFWKVLIDTCGGWVNDSEPEAEFQETVNKSKAMLKAVALAETFSKILVGDDVRSLFHFGNSSTRYLVAYKSPPGLNNW